MLDLHMHSQYSGDIDPGEGASVDELCARAVETGLTTIAVTDHCDIDGITRAISRRWISRACGATFTPPRRNTQTA